MLRNHELEDIYEIQRFFSKLKKMKRHYFFGCFLAVQKKNCRPQNCFKNSIIFNFLLNMSMRRGWTAEQDKVLKLLKEERNIKKWSSIARIMDFQFNMLGRNGKQCRERYNNHLDEGILQKKLSFEEEKLLEKINGQIGNKWSVIAKAFKGRTANFLKNQLYSKVRKSVRKLNKFLKEMKLKSVRPYKLSIVYKIVESNDFKVFQKQRHSSQDLELYEGVEIKEKLFKYAQQPLSLQDDGSGKHNQVINQSRQIINGLNQFSKKYQAFSKKTKKPRKRHFCQDDIILNSLSNNKTLQSLHQKNEMIQQQRSEQKQISSENDQISETPKKQYQQVIIPQTNRFQIRKFAAKDQGHQKGEDACRKEPETAPKITQKNTKNLNEIQKAANQNLGIVEQEELDQLGRGYRILQQSEQCQFIDPKYLESFKSCSLIDESFFQ